MVNISYIQLKDDVTENYSKTKKGWKNKDVEWSRLKNVLSNSNVQFSPYRFNNGVKMPKQWRNDKQNMLVFDVDDSMSISEAQRLFSQYKYLIGTTKSHQKLKKGLQCDRYRLCIPAINIPRNEDVYFRMLNLIVPSNDEQTSIKTGAFLGNDDAIIIYNDGRLFDCHKAAMFAEEQLAIEEAEKVVIDKDLITTKGSFDIQNLKDSLTFEIIVEILESCGYEVVNNKFKLREEERTMSANINYRSLTIKDFGSGYFGDIFDVLMKYQDMSFGEAIKFVSNHV